MNRVIQRKVIRVVNEPGYALGIGLIGVLVALLVASFVVGEEASPMQPGPMQPGLGTTVLGVYLFAWGLMFLASYYFSHKTFFLRGLMWLCENLSRPPGRKMAFFYFALACGIGSMAIFTGLGII
jgi:hypothetical protein